MVDAVGLCDGNALGPTTRHTRGGQLWRDQCKRAEDLLAPVYGWFTESFDTRDLIEAKALLDELRLAA